MKKIISILFLLCLPVLSVAQSYKGFYQTRFFNFLGDIKVIEAEFEVKDDNTIVGKLKLGNETRVLQGQVEPKGKFEARTPLENGVVTLIKGEFPVTKNEGKVSLIERREEKGKGSRSTSESGLSGFIRSVEPPVEIQDVGITDNGKTQLWFQLSNPLFGKEWLDFPAIVTISNTVGIKAFEMTMKWKTDEAERRFRFRVVVKTDNQKLWLAKEIAITSYAESKKTTDGKTDINFFLASADAISGGQIEIISENDDEIVFKITNLRFKRTAQEDFVQVDGYVHAAKSKQ